MSLAKDLGVPPTFERVRTLEGIFQQKPATRSKNSLFSSSENSSRSPSPFEDDETYHRSVSEAIPSRSPSPSGSAAAASHSAKRTHKQRSVVNISDSEEDESTPVVKRKRTLRERMTLPLTARISDPMDVDDREDAVSLGISECEQEVDDFFNKAVHKAQPGWRRIVAQAVLWGIPTPAFSTALAFFDGYRSEIVPANILQAQVGGSDISTKR